MKDKTHPTYYKAAQVTCACGNTFIVGATQQEINIEICSKCHPFYTGTQSLIDTAGRVERFKARRGKAVSKPTQKKSTRRAEKSRKRTK